MANGRYNYGKRNIKKYELSDYGDLFTIQEFIDLCECRGFIDYDGFGNYVDYDGCEIDINIMPSHIIKRNCVRNYPFVVWFNR